MEHWMYPQPSRPERDQETTVGGSNCTVRNFSEESRLHMGFPQPSADFLCFHARLKEGMVLLENCSVTALALHGTVRMKNLSFQSAVCIPITFDSWHSHQEVPCDFLKESYGVPDTDI
ncbi:unnamed protein product [Oncorhynchus mykiss]|uniref:CBM21 domain-containing protein n=1 Tax=Oncorhynchus mykiss TaxID=8022 RepID=A0A060WWN6_ONCMY|nr:unnamed protein product [Oncorhynchus mykiss]